MRSLFAALAICVGMAGPVLATDNSFPTPGGAMADGKVQMELNASGQAVPLSATSVSAGTGQYATDVSTVQTLLPPAGTTSAKICAEGGTARYRDDGGVPTTTDGMPIAADTCITYNGPMSAFQVIGDAGTTLDVSYYK